MKPDLLIPLINAIISSNVKIDVHTSYIVRVKWYNARRTFSKLKNLIANFN